jgi:hypothetical protein
MDIDIFATVAGIDNYRVSTVVQYCRRRSPPIPIVEFSARVNKGINAQKPAMRFRRETSNKEQNMPFIREQSEKDCNRPTNSDSFKWPCALKCLYD